MFLDVRIYDSDPCVCHLRVCPSPVLDITVISFPIVALSPSRGLVAGCPLIFFAFRILALARALYSVVALLCFGQHLHYAFFAFHLARRSRNCDGRTWLGRLAEEFVHDIDNNQHSEHGSTINVVVREVRTTIHQEYHNQCTNDYYTPE